MKKQIIVSMMLLSGAYSYAQLTSGSKLKFTYDTSGNQSLRNESSARANETLAEVVETPLEELTISEKEIIENAFTVSPNPTTGIATLQWDPAFSEQIINIELVSLVTSQRFPVSDTKSNAVTIDLTGKVSGLYLVVFHLNNKALENVQKKLIKL